MVTSGWPLGKKGDFDGAIAEEREALRLNPSDKLYPLQPRLGACREKVTARVLCRNSARHTNLDPKNPDYRQAYERLVQQVNR